MFKRVIALAVSMLMLTASFGAWANPAEGESLISHTVRINLSDGSAVLDDEPIMLSAPVYVNDRGDTMMEFDTLVDCLGAGISEADGVYTVEFEGVEMLYTVGSAEAVIAGQTIKLPSPVISTEDGVVVAPLRFVSEALGADVTYNGELGEIVVVSSEGMDEAVNYKLLFKYSGKSKIGHSKEHWRFTKTENFDMSDTLYGGYYEFAMDDIMLSLSCDKKKDGELLDKYYIDMQQMDSYYNKQVLFDKGKGEHKGVPYVYTKYRTLDTITENYMYEADEHFYSIYIERTFENFAGAEENADVNAFLESLEFDYNGGDEDTVDLVDAKLSDTSEEEKKEEYTDGNYNWSIKPDDKWTVEEYYGFYNKVEISGKTEVETDDEDDYYSYVTDPSILVTSYSNTEKLTAAQLAEKHHSLTASMFNPELGSLSDIQNIKIGELSAKYYTVEYTEGEDTFVSKVYFITSGDYRYEISLSYDKREEETEGFLESADAVIKSFRPGEVNAEDVGTTLEADNELELIDVTTKHEGEIFNFDYPCIWNVNDIEDGVYVSDSAYFDVESFGVMSMIYPQLALIMSATDGVSLQASINSLKYYDDSLNIQTYTAEAYMNKNIAALLNSSGALFSVEMVSPVQKTNLMGKEGYTAELVAESDGSKLYYTLYYIPYDAENVIVVTKTCTGNAKNTVYESALDKVIKSLGLK